VALAICCSIALTLVVMYVLSAFDTFLLSGA
jgi:hypothetical protein